MQYSQACASPPEPSSRAEVPVRNAAVAAERHLKMEKNNGNNTRPKLVFLCGLLLLAVGSNGEECYCDRQGLPPYASLSHAPTHAASRALRSSRVKKLVVRACKNEKRAP